jgi:hypothetical protein
MGSTFICNWPVIQTLSCWLVIWFGFPLLLHHFLSSKPPRGFDITEAWHQPAGYKVNHEKAAKGTAVGSELELIFGLFH